MKKKYLYKDTCKLRYGDGKVIEAKMPGSVK